jgi:hypothetical protein
MRQRIFSLLDSLSFFGYMDGGWKMAVRGESLIFGICKYFSMISGNAVCARIIDEFKMHEYFQLSKPKHDRMNIKQRILSSYF